MPTANGIRTLHSGQRKPFSARHMRKDKVSGKRGRGEGEGGAGRRHQLREPRSPKPEDTPRRELRVRRRGGRGGSQGRGKGNGAFNLEMQEAGGRLSQLCAAPVPCACRLFLLHLPSFSSSTLHLLTANPLTLPPYPYLPASTSSLIPHPSSSSSFLMPPSSSVLPQLLHILLLLPPAIRTGWRVWLVEVPVGQLALFLLSGSSKNFDAFWQEFTKNALFASLLSFSLSALVAAAFAAAFCAAVFLAIKACGIVAGAPAPVTFSMGSLATRSRESPAGPWRLAPRFRPLAPRAKWSMHASCIMVRSQELEVRAGSPLPSGLGLLGQCPHCPLPDARCPGHAAKYNPRDPRVQAAIML